MASAIFAGQPAANTEVWVRHASGIADLQKYRWTPAADSALNHCRAWPRTVSHSGREMAEESWIGTSVYFPSFMDHHHVRSFEFQQLPDYKAAFYVVGKEIVRPASITATFAHRACFRLLSLHFCQQRTAFLHYNFLTVKVVNTKSQTVISMLVLLVFSKAIKPSRSD